ncbi:FxsA family protein, partial [Escherichia coli]
GRYRLLAVVGGLLCVLLLAMVGWKSVSLIIAGLLLLLPGFFTDFLGLLLLLPPVQKHLTVKLMPHLRFSRMPGGGFSAGTGGGNTFDGEYQRKDDERDRLDHKDDRQD